MENNNQTKTKQHVKQARNFLIWFSVVLILSFILSLTLPADAQAASLYFSPSSGSYSIGQTFTIPVYVSSSDQAINAASGIISFPQDKLQVMSLSKAGSIMSLWVQEPSFSNTIGTINFEGIVLNPGFIGNSGKIINITFRAKSQGTTPLSITSASILANDGKGTNILTSSGSASYNIKASITTTTLPKTSTTINKTPKAVNIYSSTHPDPNKWYSDKTAIFSWNLTDDIIESKLLISKDANAVPTISYSPPVSSKTVTNLGEGVWYFYVQLKNKYGWGDIARFRLQINDVSFVPLNIRVDNEGDPTNSQPLLWFEDEDSISGIDFYNIKISRTSDGEELYDLQVFANEVSEGFYRLPSCEPGEYSLIIKAVDKDGKYSLTTMELIIEPSIISKLPIHNPLEGTRFASFGYVIINNLHIFIILSIIFAFGFIILGATLYLYSWRAKFLREGLKEEAKKTELVLYQAFNNLRKEVTKQVAKLDGNDVLSEREEEINEKLKRSIRESEKIIDEKLKNIEEKINGV
jgi:hypothetical protein